MDFKDTTPIYLQIADYIAENILVGRWPEGERIPSVRELGATLGVNPNTCVRAYELLTAQEVIAAQRGLGYHVAKGAVKEIYNVRRKEFIKTTLPEIVAKMKALDISPKMVEEMFEKL